MRKTFVTGLWTFGLALSLASMAIAQQGGPPMGGGGMRRGPGGPGGPGMMHEMLLQGITLSDAQKTQLQQLHSADSAKMEASRAAMRTQMDSAWAARERGDTATARRIWEQGRAAMMQHFEQETAAVRNILTADQRVQFDKNVTDMKARMQERMQRGGPGGPGDRPAFGPRRGLGRALFRGIALTDAQKTQLKALRAANRSSEQQNRKQRLAAVRNILTADQRAQFDKNVAAIKARAGDRRHRGWNRGDASREG